MKADGYAVLAVNETGDKAHIVDYRSHDYRLQELVQWDDMHMEECLLPDGISDCLVMVFFTYHSYPDGGWEAPHSEYAEELNIQHYVIMQENYKEFWREQISYYITYDGIKEYPREFDKQEEEWFDEDIENWEVLYDDDFNLHPRYESKSKKQKELNDQSSGFLNNFIS